MDKLNPEMLSVGLDEKTGQVCIFELEEDGSLKNKINITPQFLDTVFMTFASESGTPKRVVNAHGNGFEISLKVIKDGEIQDVGKKEKIILD